MTVPNSMSKTTAAFFVQATVAFAISFLTALAGIYFLPLDAWQRLFLGITFLFLVSSAFTLAKVIRDQQEAATVRVRLDEARIERLLADYDPLNTAS
ncbi:YiaA/YiaB family inner membrane protein [Mycobacterium marseillense]|uniref:YiaA/YiaB family inner membrane protein n=1 Tax=Mycobacterium marseillense TaxID=701042 RepID=UPI0025969523|nr:YiaA/YiaB family inner membrane protein [Mycobacterium marseillense]MDM3974541.1 YiaA/YiaB family inner membrane protein [Mycobacterium marseillense]